MYWIKMRTLLRDEPEVIQIAEALGVEQDLVVGKLHRIWSWADAHADEGVAGITFGWIDRYVECVGFAAAMSKAGWLTNHGGNTIFPNFDKHNGQSEKKRCQNYRRQQEFRKRKA